jgi:hypothetical protein
MEKFEFDCGQTSECEFQDVMTGEVKERARSFALLNDAVCTYRSLPDHDSSSNNNDIA